MDFSSLLGCKRFPINGYMELVYALFGNFIVRKCLLYYFSVERNSELVVSFMLVWHMHISANMD
jgi:hypothetical protein